MENTRILVIDDDPDICKAYQAILCPAQEPTDLSQEELSRLLRIRNRVAPARKMCFELDFALQGEAGLALVHEAMAQGRPYAMACIDIRMPPGWDGMETAQRIRQVDPDLEIAIITAYSDRSLGEIVKAVGAPDKLLFLRKPFDPEELMQLALSLTSKWNIARLHERQHQELLASEERFRSLVETTNDWIWEVDTEGRFTYSSPASETIYGHPPQELLGKTIFETVVPPQNAAEFRAFFRRCLEENASFREVERQGITRDGAAISLETSGVPVRNEQGEVVGCRGIERNITRRKKAERALIRAKKEAEAANQAKSEFLATMSHEIRTPMNGIIGMTELLLDTPLSPEQREYASTIHGSAESLLAIINEILDLSKIEAGKMTIEAIPFDLGLTVENIAAQLAVKAKDKGLEFIVRYAPDAPRQITGDPARTRQVMLNLLSNAMKFTESGHVLLNVENDPASSPPRLRISVNDTGIGIPDDKISHIFEAFTQADSSTTRQYGGTGLGLAISRLLTQLMGGSLAVESVPGQGSTFWFTLPLSPEGHRSAHAVPQFPEDLSGLRVLVANKDSLSKEVLLEQLAGWNIFHRSVESAQDALEALRSAVEDGTPYHIALVDQELPGLDPQQLFCALAGDPALRRLAVVHLGQPAPPDPPQCPAESGYAACLGKPIRPSQLLNALATIWHHMVADALQTSPPHPIQPASGPETPSQAHQRPKSFEARILLAEDNVVNQKVALRMLEKLGCQIDIAANGEEALAMLPQHRYDLVFMDCQMPVMDGFDATNAIRRMPEPLQSIPIIALTANAMAGDRERCLAAGMDDYISKPVKADELARVLERWLAHSHEHAGESSGQGTGRGTEH
ncbi:MAG: response regulator [Thermodesulfobacteriota bacterium]